MELLSIKEAELKDLDNSQPIEIAKCEDIKGEAMWPLVKSSMISMIQPSKQKPGDIVQDNVQIPQDNG